MGVQAHGQQALDLMLLEDVIDGAQDVGFAFEVINIELGRQLPQGRFGCRQSLLAAVLIPSALVAGDDPVDRIARLIDVIAGLEEIEVLDGGLIVGSGPPSEKLFGQGGGAQLVLETAGLQEILGQNRHGLAPVLDDMRQLFVGAELAVGHVEEVGRAMDPAQSVPRFDGRGPCVARWRSFNLRCRTSSINTNEARSPKLTAH